MQSPTDKAQARKPMSSVDRLKRLGTIDWVFDDNMPDVRALQHDTKRLERLIRKLAR